MNFFHVVLSKGIGHVRQHDCTSRRDEGQNQFDQVVGILVKARCLLVNHQAQHGPVQLNVKLGSDLRHEHGNRWHEVPPRVQLNAAVHMTIVVNGVRPQGQVPQQSRQGQDDNVQGHVFWTLDEDEDGDHRGDLHKSVPQNRPLEVFQPLVEPGNIKSNREQVDRLSPHVGLVAGIKGHEDHKGQVGNNRHHSLDDLDFSEGRRHLLLVVSDVSNFPVSVIADPNVGQQHEVLDDGVGKGIGTNPFRAQYPADVVGSDQRDDDS